MQGTRGGDMKSEVVDPKKAVKAFPLMMDLLEEANQLIRLLRREDSRCGDYYHREENAFCKKYKNIIKKFGTSKSEGNDDE
jgi:hypothetical protein